MLLTRPATRQPSASAPGATDFARNSAPSGGTHGQVSDLVAPSAIDRSPTSSDQLRSTTDRLQVILQGSGVSGDPAGSAFAPHEPCGMGLPGAGSRTPGRAWPAVSPESWRRSAGRSNRSTRRETWTLCSLRSKRVTLSGPRARTLIDSNVPTNPGGRACTRT